MATITCGRCRGTHAAVGVVKACHDGALVGPCGDLVSEGYDECGDLQTAECGAEAIFDARGYRCANGHEYVTMQARHDEGWDYAESDEEAAAMARAGINPVVTGPGLPLFIGAGA